MYHIIKSSELEILGKLEAHIKSIQSTNDKRYNEIMERIGQNDAMINGFLVAKKIVTCDTCKCLLYKDDAIKGESRINKTNGRMKFGFKNGMITYENVMDEEIETPYYCRKCNPLSVFEGGINIKVEDKCNSKQKSKKSNNQKDI